MNPFSRRRFLGASAIAASATAVSKAALPALPEPVIQDRPDTMPPLVPSTGRPYNPVVTLNGSTPAQGGNNFGWPIREGSHCFSPPAGCQSAGLTAPIIEYPHGPACSVTGGYVYRGRKYPDLRGTYFYGDYCTGFIRPVRLVNGAAMPVYAPLSPPLVNDNVVPFGEDADGEIYVVMASGRVYRIALAG